MFSAAASAEVEEGEARLVAEAEQPVGRSAPVLRPRLLCAAGAGSVCLVIAACGSLAGAVVNGSVGRAAATCEVRTDVEVLIRYLECRPKSKVGWQICEDLESKGSSSKRAIPCRKRGCTWWWWSKREKRNCPKANAKPYLECTSSTHSGFSVKCKWPYCLGSEPQFDQMVNITIGDGPSVVYHCTLYDKFLFKRDRKLAEGTLTIDFPDVRDGLPPPWTEYVLSLPDACDDGHPGKLHYTVLPIISDCLLPLFQ